jgi:rubredoxin
MKYKCDKCGWVYDGDDFKGEPDSFKCPECGAPKSDFSAVKSVKEGRYNALLNKYLK